MHTRTPLDLPFDQNAVILWTIFLGHAVYTFVTETLPIARLVQKVHDAAPCHSFPGPIALSSRRLESNVVAK